MVNAPQRVKLSFGGSLTPVVRMLLWLNGAAYLFSLLVQRKETVLPTVDGIGLPVSYTRLILQLFGLVPHAVTREWALWQPITYMFLHQEFLHLLLNMLALWWFGADVERRFGSKLFFRYYFLCGIGAALTSIAMSWNSSSATIGASGAVFGLLLAYGILFPDRVIYLYLVIPVKAKYCVAAFALLELLTLVWTSADGVNHIAHLGGMLFGLGWFGYYRSGFNLVEFLRKWQRQRLRRRLRLIRRGGANGEKPPGDYDKPTIH